MICFRIKLSWDEILVTELKDLFKIDKEAKCTMFLHEIKYELC